MHFENKENFWEQGQQVAELRKRHTRYFQTWKADQSQREEREGWWRIRTITSQSIIKVGFIHTKMILLRKKTAEHINHFSKTQPTKSPPPIPIKKKKKKSLKITSTKIPRGVCRSRAKLDQRGAAGAFEVFRSSTYRYTSQQSLEHSWQLPRQHLRFLIKKCKSYPSFTS